MLLSIMLKLTIIWSLKNSNIQELKIFNQISNNLWFKKIIINKTNGIHGIIKNLKYLTTSDFKKY